MEEEEEEEDGEKEVTSSDLSVEDDQDVNDTQQQQNQHQEYIGNVTKQEADEIEEDDDVIEFIPLNTVNINRKKRRNVISTSDDDDDDNNNNVSDADKQASSAVKKKKTTKRLSTEERLALDEEEIGKEDDDNSSDHVDVDQSSLQRVDLKEKILGVLLKEGKLNRLSPILSVVLKPHQIAGVRFLFDHVSKKGGCVLADYMGLGKTIQVLSLIHSFMCPTKSGLLTSEIEKEINENRNEEKEAALLIKNDDVAIELDDEVEAVQSHKNQKTKIDQHFSSSSSTSAVLNKKKCVLILCPSTVVENWCNEVDKWFGVQRVKEMQKFFASLTPNSPNVDLWRSRQNAFHPKEFKASLDMLNIRFIDSSDTYDKRVAILEDWKSSGGVLVMSYEQFRLLSTPSISKKPRNIISKSGTEKKRGTSRRSKTINKNDDDDFISSEDDELLWSSKTSKKLTKKKKKPAISNIIASLPMLNKDEAVTTTTTTTAISNRDLGNENNAAVGSDDDNYDDDDDEEYSEEETTTTTTPPPDRIKSRTPLLKKETEDSLSKMPKNERIAYQALCYPGPHLVILDEGHRLKHSKSLLVQSLARIHTKSRVVLTGYPLQNHLKEYYCMMDFAVPGILGSEKYFNAQFIKPIMAGRKPQASNIERRLGATRTYILTKTLRPKVLRRDNTTLKNDLPPKYEWLVYCKMSPIQQKFYEGFLKSFEVTDIGKNDGMGLLVAYHHSLAIFNHPDILYLKFQESASKSSNHNNNNNNYTNKGNGSSGKKTKLLYDEDIEIVDEFPEDDGTRHSYDWAGSLLQGYRSLAEIATSGKMSVLISILTAADKVGDKTIVFSQSIATLNIIGQILSRNGHSNKFVRIDGSTPQGERTRIVDVFNNDKKILVILCSTRACGEGINLVSANRIVMMDTCWNPCVDHEAMCRAYRYGQKKPVYVYRLVGAGTMEQGIYNQQIRKEVLTKTVIDSRGVKDARKVDAEYLLSSEAFNAIQSRIDNGEYYDSFVKEMRERKNFTSLAAAAAAGASAVVTSLDQKQSNGVFHYPMFKEEEDDDDDDDEDVKILTFEDSNSAKLSNERVEALSTDEVLKKSILDLKSMVAHVILADLLIAEEETDAVSEEEKQQAYMEFVTNHEKILSVQQKENISFTDAESKVMKLYGATNMNDLTMFNPLLSSDFRIGAAADGVAEWLKLGKEIQSVFPQHFYKALAEQYSLNDADFIMRIFAQRTGIPINSWKENYTPTIPMQPVSTAFVPRVLILKSKMPEDIYTKVKMSIEKLNGSIQVEWSENITHIITNWSKERINDYITRQTLRDPFFDVSKVYFVTPEWAFQSARGNKWLQASGFLNR